MNTYTVHFRTDRNYADHDIEADTPEEALAIARQLCKSRDIYRRTWFVSSGDGRDGVRAPVRLRHGRSGEAHAGEPRPIFKRAIGRQPEGTGNGCAQLFSAGADAPLHREAK